VFRARHRAAGRSLRQTLEPRAFYVNTPYRDQSLLPQLRFGANDFSFATISAENAFVGNDRIADSNLLTLEVTEPAARSRHRRRGGALRHCAEASL